METHVNNYRYKHYYDWEVRKDAPYDYERNGLLRHLLSHVVINAATTEDGQWKPNALGALLRYIETSFINVMKYIDRMKNFKNYAY